MSLQVKSKYKQQVELLSETPHQNKKELFIIQLLLTTLKGGKKRSK